MMVWNPLSWNRTDIVEANVQMPQAEPNGISVLDAEGRPVAMQVLSSNAATHSYHLLLQPKNVPSIGYTVLHAVPGSRKITSDLQTNGTTIENSLLRVVMIRKMAASPASTTSNRILKVSLQDGAVTYCRHSSISRKNTTHGTSIPTS